MSIELKILRLFASLVFTIYQVASQDDNIQDPPIRNLDGIYSWKAMEYGFPTESDKECAIASGFYEENVGIPFDVDVSYDDNNPREVFITTATYAQVVPYTLAVVTNKKGPNGPILQPFPDYQTHLSHGLDCDGITNAFTISITKCNTMYVLDNGIVETKTKCPPQILVYDVPTRELIYRHRFSKKMYIKDFSFFEAMKVDVLSDSSNASCLDSMVYVSDVKNNNLIVLDAQKHKSWIVSSRWMYPDPEAANISVGNDFYLEMFGIFTLSLQPKSMENRKLIFNAYNGFDRIAIPIDLLNNRTIWKNPKTFPNDDAFEVINGPVIQPPSADIDRSGKIYAVYYKSLSLWVWDTNLPPIVENYNLLVYNPKTLQFGSSVKIITRPTSDAEEVWVVTNRFTKFYNDNYNYGEINFRVMACTTEQLLADEICRVSL